MGGSLDGGGIMGCGADLDRLSMTTATDPLANAATTATIIGAFAGTIITTTTTGNSQTLASPTDTTAGKVFTIVNNDTSTNTFAVVANSVSYTIAIGSGQSFIWDGSKWMPTSMGITALPVTVSQGGTGLATITDHAVMLGSGTSAVTPLTVGTDNQILTGVTGADPTFKSTIDGVTIGSTTASTGVFSTLDAKTDITIKGTTGGFVRKFYEATANIEADASTTITLNIPTSAVILGCQLRVDAALAATELWDAAYSGGSTEAICTAQAVAQNTKVNSFVTDTTDNTTNIAITKNGGGSFSLQGTIRAIVYTEEFDAMASL